MRVREKPMEEKPVLSPATPFEERAVALQLKFLSEQRYTSWWPVEEEKRRREVPRFSDRYHRDNAKNGSQSLKIREAAYMQREAFPRGLWKAFMDGEDKKADGKRSDGAGPSKKRTDWKRMLERLEVNLSRSSLSFSDPQTMLTRALTADRRRGSPGSVTISR